MTIKMFFKNLFGLICDGSIPNKYGLQKYLVNDGKEHPFAIVIPGGAYQWVGNSVEGKPFAKKLNEAGIHAFVLDYRVKKKSAYPAPFEDLACGIREIFDNAKEWKVDTSNYSVWGSSAGGHLAGSFCTKTAGYLHFDVPRPASLVMCYPVVSMKPELTHELTFENITRFHNKEECINMLSIDNNIDSDFPKTFLWCGLSDSVVDPENSYLLDRALTEKGVEHIFNAYEGVEHGVGIGKGLVCEGWIDEAIDFCFFRK